MPKPTKAQIKAAIAAALADPNNKLKAAISRMYAGNATPEQVQLVIGAAETCEAWFDQRKLTEEQLGPVFMDAVRGYLRTSKNGGMPSDLADAVEAAMDNFVHIGCLSSVVHPFLEGKKQ